MIRKLTENEREMALEILNHEPAINLFIIGDIENLSKLCHDVLEEGKTVCLFYDSLKTGSVYHSIGFESIDKWRMLVKSK